VKRALAAAALLVVAAAAGGAAKPPKPPVAKRVDVVSTLHGDERHDAYAWLERRADPEVVAYLDAENAYATEVLRPEAKRIARLEREMRARVVEDDADVPVRRGRWRYFRVHQAGKAYPIYMRRGVDADDLVERVTLDLNAVAEAAGAYVDLGVYEVSDDGRWLAYSIDTVGDEKYTLYLKDLESGALAAERIANVSDAAWAADGKTLVYTVRNEAYRSYAAYVHVRGGAATDARVVEEKDDHFDLSIDRTRDGEWLVLHSASYDASEVRVARATAPGGAWRVVAPRRAGHTYELDHGGDTFYIRTNLRAPMFRVVAAPEDDPGVARWKDVVPARADVHVGSAEAFAGHLVLVEREGGRPYLTVCDERGGGCTRAPAPGAAWGIVADASWNPSFDAAAYRYGVATFERPVAIVEASLANAASVRVLKQPKVPGGYDPAAYASEATTARAADGTAIPVSLVYRKRGKADGKAKRTPRPLLLEAYGAYGEPFDPEWDEALPSLLDRGVVVAIAHVRGGGERGEPWHDAARLGHRLVAANDLVAVAEGLVRDGWTTPAQLGVTGLSAGGLLVAIALNLRPELFRVALLEVPFVTAVDSMLDADVPLTTTEYEEWGDPRDPAAYAYMKAYDPYGNLGAHAYPAMFVASSFDDGRVRYSEQAKYVARLRHVRTDARPLLLRTEMHGGHGGASGRYARLAHAAEADAFVLAQLGVR
jgi:oligopeptidase B